MFVCIDFVFWFVVCFFVAAGVHLLCRSARRIRWTTSGEQRSSTATSRTYLIPRVSNHPPHVKICCKHLLNVLDAKGLWQPGQSFISAGFKLSLPRPDPCESQHLSQRQRSAATQHSLRNCVDHLAALSHVGYTRNTMSWNWTVTKLIQLLWGIDSITFRFLQYPFFYCWNTN